MPKQPTPSQQCRMEQERKRHKQQEQRRNEIARLNAVPIEDTTELRDEVERLKRTWDAR